MSKKSKFSNQQEIPKNDEFLEKADEEEELEEDENNKIPPQKDNDMKKQDPFDISDDEDEVQDKISDLNSVPNFFEVPKPVSSGKIPLPNTSDNPLLKKYEPLDWHSAFPISYNICNDTLPIYIQGEQGPNIICLHGAGHSGLSFAPLALMNKEYRIISFDFRGHGFNKQEPNKDFEILKEGEKYQELYKKMQGLIVIDVVEGTAMDALPFMENIVHNRPDKFNSIQKGIEYMYKSGTIKNLDSARISVPPLLREEKNEKTGKNYFVFKTNLLDSKPFWNEWFIGLTKAFLSCNIPKMLMLAGIERMDKDLTIAQMQGKYKLSIMRNVGHVMHEDKPEEAMKFIKEFVHTFRITAKETEMKPIIGKLGNQDPNQKVIVPLKYDKWNANK